MFRNVCVAFFLCAGVGFTPTALAQDMTFMPEEAPSFLSVRARHGMNLRTLVRMARRHGATITEDDVVAANPGKIIYACYAGPGDHYGARTPDVWQTCPTAQHLRWLVTPEQGLGIRYRIPLQSMTQPETDMSQSATPFVSTASPATAPAPSGIDQAALVDQVARTIFGPLNQALRAHNVQVDREMETANRRSDERWQWTIFAIVMVLAVACLLVAIFVWRSRKRAATLEEQRDAERAEIVANAREAANAVADRRVRKAEAAQAEAEQKAATAVAARDALKQEAEGLHAKIAEHDATLARLNGELERLHAIEERTKAIRALARRQDALTRDRIELHGWLVRYQKLVENARSFPQVTHDLRLEAQAKSIKLSPMDQKLRAISVELKTLLQEHLGLDYSPFPERFKEELEAIIAQGDELVRKPLEEEIERLRRQVEDLENTRESQVQELERKLAELRQQSGAASEERESHVAALEAEIRRQIECRSNEGNHILNLESQNVDFRAQMEVLAREKLDLIAMIADLVKADAEELPRQSTHPQAPPFEDVPTAVSRPQRLASIRLEEAVARFLNELPQHRNALKLATPVWVDIGPVARADLAFLAYLTVTCHVCSAHIRVRDYVKHWESEHGTALERMHKLTEVPPASVDPVEPTADIIPPPPPTGVSESESSDEVREPSVSQVRLRDDAAPEGALDVAVGGGSPSTPHTIH